MSMDLDNIIEVDLDSIKTHSISMILYQYDRGLMLRLLNVPQSDEYSIEVEMCNALDKAVEHTFTYCGDDIEIPDDLLQRGRDLKVYLFAKGDNWGKTLLSIDVIISRRPSR